MASIPPLTGEEAPPEAGPKKGFRARGIVAGLLLCFPVAYAFVSQGTSTIYSLPTPPISALLFLVILNVVLRKLAPKAAFNQADLLVSYAIASIGGCMAGEWPGVVQPLIAWLPTQAATNPVVRDTMLKQLPDWMVITDQKAVRDAFGGGKNWVYATHRFVDIILPRAVPWIAVLAALTLAMLFINLLMQEAWCKRERLSFPLIQLPVAMSENGGVGGMWKNRAMWIAFTVMFGIDILNGLNYLYPNLPSIPVKTILMVNTIFKDPPLSQMGDLRISIFPFMAAIGLFMPSDMLLSFVVFFFLRILTHILLAANGIPQQTFSGSGIQPGAPYFDEQTWGAVFALFLGTIWVSREYLRELWRNIRQFRPSPDGGVRPAWAFTGLLLCSAVLVAFATKVGGLPIPYAIVYLAAFYIFSIVLTRVRAQLGPPTNEFAYFGVNSLLGRFLGNRWLSDQQATWVTSGFLPMNRIYRNHPMPVMLEALKMGQLQGLKPRRLLWAMPVAIVLGLFLIYYFHCLNLYRTGDFGGSDGPNFLNTIIGDRHGPDATGIVMTIVGFAIVMILDAIRFRFPAFPLHPAGYFLSMNFGVDYYWFGLLLALLVKTFVQRYYGLSGYDRLRAVALGILLGEYAAETIWMTMAIITHQSTYTISFNDRSLGVQ